MKLFLGATDREWFNLLRMHQASDVNFWKPSAPLSWNAVPVGAPFLLKLREAPHVVGGVGFFVRYSVMPTSIAWRVFETGNGARSLLELQQKIRSISSSAERDPKIGCIVLCQTVFFGDEDFIPLPVSEYRLNGPGASLDTSEGVGKRLWDAVQDRLNFSNFLDLSDYNRNQERTILQRVGQHGFRVLVMDAYQRRCAITGERTLPALEASHILPYAENGKHLVENGLFLRSDLHKLFDDGYLTVTPELKVEISPRIREEFENGREYYALHGKPLMVVPKNPDQLPAPELLRWHNERRFAA